MIDIRCPRCGETIETLELDNTTTFSSQISKTVCNKCKKELLSIDFNSPEARLVSTILGETKTDLFGWEVEEDEVTEN